MLAGLMPGDDPEIRVPELNVSYKPQKIVPKSGKSRICKYKILVLRRFFWRIFSAMVLFMAKECSFRA
jgi:hypothetical protein